MGITILGLGPGDPQMLTLEARALLDSVPEILLRTRRHPTVAALPTHLRIRSFDELYERMSDFESIYDAIAEDILARGAQGEVLYAVPGNPLFGETSVQKILAQARQRQIPTRVVAGVSFVDATCAALALDPLACGLQILDATDLARQHFPRLDPDQPALVGQVYSGAIASDCKLTLLVVYPPDHAVTLVQAAGTAEQQVRTIPLEDLDRTDQSLGDGAPSPDGDRFGLLTSLYLPSLPRPGSLNALAEIVAHLRSPEGCPWDRKQTHASLRSSLLEEAYEVLEAIDEDDMHHLQEELGDLLLHVLLQTQIAQEGGEFQLTNVIEEISAKLIRRHPHVFGDVKVSSTDEIVANWEKIKQAENGGKSKRKSRVPRGTPALAHAQRLAHHDKQKPRAQDIAERVEKLGRARNREQALGQVLFELAAFASAKDVDAESALRAFAQRREAEREE